MSKFYGVGVGPGDPELITLKAVNLIKNAKYIFSPKSRDNSMAQNIVKDYLKGKEIIELEFPMGKDNAERYMNAAKLAEEKLKSGDIVFITLGDPMTYSTYIYLLRELEKLNIETETVPGISSFTAAASRINQPLAIKNENIYICDSVPEKDVLEKCETVCILKCNKNKSEIIDLLEEYGFNYYFIKRVSGAEELVLTEKDEIVKEDDYMSIIIGRKN